MHVAAGDGAGGALVAHGIDAIFEEVFGGAGGFFLLGCVAPCRGPGVENYPLIDVDEEGVDVFAGGVGGVEGCSGDLAAPAGSPAFGLAIDVEGGEEGRGLTLGAVVVGGEEFGGIVVVELLPVDVFEVGSVEEFFDGAVAEGDAVCSEGVVAGLGDGVFAEGGDDQGLLACEADFSDGCVGFVAEELGDFGEGLGVGFQVEPSEVVEDLGLGGV